MSEEILDMGPESKVPNATAVLLLGIFSIIGCCFYIGPLLAIIGLILGAKGTKTYKASPQSYLKSSYSQLSTGKILCWISIAFTIIALIVLAIVFAMVGSDGFQQMMECNEYESIAERQECMQEVMMEIMGVE